MSYDLMLLSDPGPERARVLAALQQAPDIRPDPELDTRFWLTTPHGEAQLNIGSKDPVESIHLYFDIGHLPLLDAVARRALELADDLDMRVEDMQWGHELTRANLNGLMEYWRTAKDRPREAPEAPREPRPWWKFW
jgi:hypothetical protein